jgi:hypothetical protein
LNRVATLVVITGPIGVGKSTVSTLLGRRLSRAGKDAAVVDLDDVEFMQHTGTLDVGEWWARGLEAHASLVARWFDLGVDIVVAHGPLVAVGAHGYDVGPLLRAVPIGTLTSHALLTAPFDVALARVRNDDDRAPSALSRNEAWLRGTHERFTAALTTAPAFRWQFDTVSRSASTVADILAADLCADAE